MVLLVGKWGTLNSGDVIIWQEKPESSTEDERLIGLVHYHDGEHGVT